MMLLNKVYPVKKKFIGVFIKRLWISDWLVSALLPIKHRIFQLFNRVNENPMNPDQLTLEIYAVINRVAPNPPNRCAWFWNDFIGLFISLDKK